MLFCGGSRYVKKRGKEHCYGGGFQQNMSLVLPTYVAAPDKTFFDATFLLKPALSVFVVDIWYPLFRYMSSHCWINFDMAYMSCHVSRLLQLRNQMRCLAQQGLLFGPSARRRHEVTYPSLKVKVSHENCPYYLIPSTSWNLYLSHMVSWTDIWPPLPHKPCRALS